MWYTGNVFTLSTLDNDKKQAENELDNEKP